MLLRLSGSSRKRGGEGRTTEEEEGERERERMQQSTLLAKECQCLEDAHITGRGERERGEREKREREGGGERFDMVASRSSTA